MILRGDTKDLESDEKAGRLQRAEIKAAERPAARWGDGSGFILGSLGVPDHHISICSRDDPPFPGVEVVDLGRVRARDRHEAILVYLSSNLRQTTTTFCSLSPFITSNKPKRSRFPI